jgi:hypothetical protein
MVWTARAVSSLTLFFTFRTSTTAFFYILSIFVAGSPHQVAPIPRGSLLRPAKLDAALGDRHSCPFYSAPTAHRVGAVLVRFLVKVRPSTTAAGSSTKRGKTRKHIVYHIFFIYLPRLTSGKVRLRHMPTTEHVKRRCSPT